MADWYRIPDQPGNGKAPGSRERSARMFETPCVQRQAQSLIDGSIKGLRKIDWCDIARPKKKTNCLYAKRKAMSMGFHYADFHLESRCSNLQTPKFQLGSWLLFGTDFNHSLRQTIDLSIVPQEHGRTWAAPAHGPNWSLQGLHEGHRSTWWTQWFWCYYKLTWLGDKIYIVEVYEVLDSGIDIRAIWYA